jgi:hypothetical protein
MSVDHDNRGTLLTADGPELAEVAGTPAARPWWRRPPSVRTVLIAAVLAAFGFAGGVLTAKHEGVTTASAAGRGTALTAAAGREATTTGQGAAAGTGGATVGTVKLVNGSTIYLTTTNGSVVKVTTSGSTKLSVSATGKASDLKAGETVVVQGSTDSTGGVTATSVTATGSTAAGGTGGGAAGGAAGAGARTGAPASVPAG